MKYFSELYNQIKNPLLNGDALNYLLKFRYPSYNYFIQNYSNTKKTKSNVEQYPYRDRFYFILYAIWKNHLLTSNKQQLSLLNDTHDGRIYEIYDFLSHQNKAHTTYESYEKTKKKYPFIEKYYLLKGEDWVHISSGKLAIVQQPVHCQHRLYINPNPDDMYFLLSLFSRNALKNNIPFYYKFDDTAQKDRDDSIVLYANDSNLFSYINLLNAISRENPQLIARCHKPPILTGHLNNWIGYATEPLPELVDKYFSYNYMLSKLMEEALKETLALSKNKSQDTLQSLFSYTIAKNAGKYGLDANKICFSTRTREKVLEEQSLER